jgi:hypothetical protein
MSPQVIKKYKKLSIFFQITKGEKGQQELPTITLSFLGQNYLLPTSLWVYWQDHMYKYRYV